MSQPYKIIIPMAGYGSRMRPLTWSRPKPLLPLAGKTVLDYALDQFASLPGIENAEYVFISSPNQGESIQLYMQQAHPTKKVHFVTQDEMLGQSHALWCAREYLSGPSLIAFSDTLIETDLGFIPPKKWMPWRSLKKWKIPVGSASSKSTSAAWRRAWWKNRRTSATTRCWWAFIISKRPAR